MFAKKLPSLQTKKKQAIDVLLARLNDLSPNIDMLIAGTSACFAMVSVYVYGMPFVGILGTISAMCFAFLAINATLREMRWLKFLEANASESTLKSMNRQQFEFFLTILFKMSGYQIRSAVNELHRQDDADWIITKKKEVILVQFNHFDEDAVGMQALQSLQKAAMIFQATGAIAITAGTYRSDAKQWGTRKGLQLLTSEDLLGMAAEFTGAPESSDTNAQTEGSAGTASSSINNGACVVFVDFAGIPSCAEGLAEVFAQFPAVSVIASTHPVEIPPEELLQDADLVVSGQLDPHPAGRYFAINHFLEQWPSGKQVPWIALDSDPQQFPAGCSELVAINPSFGVNAAAKDRLKEALGLSIRRLALAAH